MPNKIFQPKRRMESIKTLFKVGFGPSSSHTMGPAKAAKSFLQEHPEAARIEATLHGSLALTGRGHLTDVAIVEALKPIKTDILWNPKVELPFHPNGMLFTAYDKNDEKLGDWEVYSVGGGTLSNKDSKDVHKKIYELNDLTDISDLCKEMGWTFWEYVASVEEDDIEEYLGMVLGKMKLAIMNGLKREGVLPGSIRLKRKAKRFYRRLKLSSSRYQSSRYLGTYALAVAEENASGGEVVTAPTCGSCGILPSVLRFMEETIQSDEDDLVHALMIAGLIGNLARTNASISGAEVGCQGEVGVACAMAAAAANFLMGGTLEQIEYAAEMALEQYLGLTCDPVDGLVQIPCIDRNAFAAMRAVEVANYALLSDGNHQIPFDEVVMVMMETGQNMSSIYKETSSGGLAAIYRRWVHGDKCETFNIEDEK